ncbi:hypothetical protein HAX54_002187 [Datura stramonium]|uniref:Uncharacterized protein n=1 Tax=Datura stramonium TaxID=4076 RepID=A0ABS8RI63_DATST|nr:hypothetical protein [Datura stramonium]
MAPKVNKGKGVASSIHEKEEAVYRLAYDPRGIDMTKTKEPKDYSLSKHSRSLCIVGPGYEESVDDDVATEDELARVDSDIKCSDYNEEES